MKAVLAALTLVELICPRIAPSINKSLSFPRSQFTTPLSWRILVSDSVFFQPVKIDTGFQLAVFRFNDKRRDSLGLKQSNNVKIYSSFRFFLENQMLMAAISKQFYRSKKHWSFTLLWDHIHEACLGDLSERNENSSTTFTNSFL